LKNLTGKTLPLINTEDTDQNQIGQTYYDWPSPGPGIATLCRLVRLVGGDFFDLLDLAL
jgi:hypothetical protein